MDRWKRKESEWLDERRESPRWVDGRMAFIRSEDREQLAVTGDISLGGMQLAVVGDRVSDPGPEVAVDVAFERQVLELHGRVAYTVAKDWGFLVGVRFNRGSEAVRDFLTLRYECSPEGARRAQ